MHETSVIKYYDVSFLKLHPVCGWNMCGSFSDISVLGMENSTFKFSALRRKDSIHQH